MLDADINCIADLDAWAEDWLMRLHGNDGPLFHRDLLADRWDEAIEYAHALHAPDLLGQYDQSMRRPRYVIGDYDSMQRSIVDDLALRLRTLRKNIGGTDGQRTADKIKNSIVPDDVNNCANYIKEQWRLVAAGKRPRANKKALIAEFLQSDDTSAMQRALQPTRFGWLLSANGQADK
jgi:hypothetical protein